MGITPIKIFQNLLTELPRGTPLTSAWLQERGLTAKQVARLGESGWLARLGRGVYLLPGDTLNRDAALAHLAQVAPGFHVAGKTALAWRGVRHNLAFKERLVLWGDKPLTLPAWFTADFPARYQSTQLFDADLARTAGLAPLPGGHSGVMVSTQERALLELLSDVGKGQGLEETKHLVEGIRSLREPVLDELLSHILRIKVVRLADALATELELPWRELVRKHSERLGGGQRWVSITKSGERLNLKRPS